MTGPNGRDIVTRSLWEQAENGDGPAKVGWSDVDGELLMKAVVILTDSGAAITLGTTSDGGALMVAVLDGGKVHKSYFHDTRALDLKLAALIKLG